jgi:hypothetical protein
MNDSDQFVLVPPRADAMVESMRSFGYTLEAAIADLADNGIFARASHIWVDFWWEGPESAIVVTDDGTGMTGDELKEAMRPGSINPLEPRDPEDLGRFGLGLKTASFSQCRLLTVCSKASASEESTAAWDLDFVGSTREWRLKTAPARSDNPLFDRLRSRSNGTAVVWQKLDRIVGAAPKSDDIARDHFLGRAARVEEHLAMTFHRFFEGKARVTLEINERPIMPWNPFLENHPATQELYNEALKIFGKSLRVRPFVLPHKSHLTQEEHSKAAGPKGWNAQQGFYIYRNRRLIVSGSWLELGPKQEEHFKLARILVDLPNTMDQEWQVDVRKAHAIPPPSLIAPLRRISKITRDRASEVYRHRGQVVRRAHGRNYEFVWEKVSRTLGGQNRFLYRINRSHPIIKQSLETKPQVRSWVRSLFELIESTLPIEGILIQNAENPESITRPQNWETSSDLQQRGVRIFKAFLKDGLSEQEAYQRLALIEPFDNSPKLRARVEELMEGGKS